MFFWGVLNAFLGSVSSIFWKKALELSVVPDRVFFGIGLLGSTVLSLGILAFGGFSVVGLPWWIVAIPVLDSVAVTYAATLSQRIYKEEKMSALMPFDHLSSVITIVAAFFLFGDTPLGTLLIAVGIIAMIFVASFDFKNRHFPKNFGLIFANHGINAARSLVIAYGFSAHLTNSTFYVARNLTVAALVWGMIFAFSQVSVVRSSSREFLVPRLSASFLWAVSAFLGFAILAKFGLVTSTLLGFLSMVSTLLLGRAYLNDRPEKKNVVLAVSVAFLVALGTYLKAAAEKG